MKKIFAASFIVFLMISTTVFAGNTGIADTPQTTACGYSCSAAITEDGKLMVWGANYSGYLGVGGTSDVILPTEVMDNVASVHISENSPTYIAALKTDGTLWTWGDNTFGKLGDGQQANRTSPQQIMTGVKAVSLGFAHTAVIKDDGSLWMWGLNNYGQLGDGTKENNPTPHKIMDDVAAVSLGMWHSVAVKNDGTLWVWGCNNCGQLGNGSSDSYLVPQKIMDEVALAQAREQFTAVIKKDGSLWMCGTNLNGELGYTGERNSSVFKKALDGVKCVSLGYRYVLAVKNNGELWGWGCGGALGDGKIDAITPIKKIMGEGEVNSVAAGYNHSLILKNDGTLLSCGRNYNGQLGDGNNMTNEWTLSPEAVSIGKVKTVNYRWNTCEVTLEPMGGDIDTREITVTYGSTYGNLPEPTRTGYAFDGWYTEDDEPITNDTEVTVTGAVTLYAHWTANTYEVTLEPMGGDVDTREITVTYGSTYGDLPEPTRTGYSFDGWYTENDEPITNDTEVTVTGAVTLYAHWTANTYEVTLEPMGGDVDTKEITVTYGSTYGDLPEPTRTGYAFDGWYTENDEPITNETEVTITGAVTLYAHWTANTYEVTLEPMGGDVDTKEITVTYGSTYGDLPEPTRTGYAFDGWYTENDEPITNETEVTVTGAVTLYAHWTANTYEVTLEPMGGDVDINKITVTYGSTYGDLPEPTRTGYAFDGWYTENDEPITNETEVTITGVVTLYAHWTANTYEVTLEPMGGDVDTKEITVTYGSTYGDLPEPTRTGYAFDGWYTEDDEPITNETEVTITGAVTLYAHWTANTYTVAFDPNGGAGVTESSVYSYDSEKALTKNGFTKKYYFFVGWNTKPDGGGDPYADEAKVKNLTSENGKVITLYAQWQRINTKTTLESRDGHTVCNVKINGAAAPCSIILAAYKDGRLVAVEARDYSKLDESFSVEEDFDTVKVMLWNGLGAMEPISEVEVLKK